MDLARILRNVSSQWIALAAQLAISVLMTPFLVHRLGDDGYGIIVLVSGLVGYSGLLYLGLGAAVVKYVAEHHAADDQDALNRTASTIFAVYLAFGVACFVVAMLVAYPMPLVFHVPAAHANEARAMVVMMGFALLVQFPGSIYGGVLMGLERFDLLNTYNFVLLIARTAATIALVSWRPSVALVGAVTMCSFIAEQALAMFYTRRLMPGLVLSLRLYERSRLRTLFTFSTQSFLFTLSEKLINYTDEFVISQYHGTQAVTFYALPLRLVDYAREFIDKATLVLMPGVSAAASRREIGTVHALWRFGNKAAMCLVAPVTLVFLVWGRHVLTLWMDDRHGRIGAASLFWLALAFVVQVAGRGLARPIFEGLGELSTPARITVAEGVSNFVLSVILVRVWGVPGVAFATFLPAAVTGFVVMPWYVCKRLGTSYWRHVFDTFVRTLPPLVPAYGVLRLAEGWGLQGNLVTTGLTCFVVLVVYVAFAAFVTFDADDRAALRARVSSRLGG